MSKSRLVRGRKTQRIFAEYILPYFPLAKSRPAAEPGSDIENTPGVDFELKASRTIPLLKALRQSEKRAKGALSVVIWRPDGYGEERVGSWVMAMRVQEGMQILAEAGYGDNPMEEDHEASN